MTPAMLAPIGALALLLLLLPGKGAPQWERFGGHAAERVVLTLTEIDVSGAVVRLWRVLAR